jgi:hypothetical protein
MRKKLTLLIAALSLGVLFTQVVQAHHSFSQFDRSLQKIIKGEVTKWAFNNPHVWIHIDEEGSDEAWSFEGGGLVHLLRKGIKGDAFKPGDQVTIMYCPLRDGRAGGAIGWIMRDDEPMVNPSDGGCMVNDAVEERWVEWLKQGFTSNVEAEAA